MPTLLNEGEKKEPEWWCKHHKANVLHLCHRMLSIIEAIENEDEEGLNILKSMMKTQLPAFIESASR